MRAEDYRSTKRCRLEHRVEPCAMEASADERYVSEPVNVAEHSVRVDQNDIGVLHTVRAQTRQQSPTSSKLRLQRSHPRCRYFVWCDYQTEQRLDATNRTHHAQQYFLIRWPCRSRNDCRSLRG
jgi:hypothetical protein